MTSTLQDAIGAVRQGDVEMAQRQLAEVISANPDNVQAWYLLSQIVDSDARRAAYLSKTLALDPYHERAWAEFFSLPVDVVARLETGQAPDSAVATPVVNDVAMAATTTAVASTLPEVDIDTALPDWLRPVAKDQPVVAQRREVPVTKATERAPQPPASTQPAVSEPAAQGNKSLSVLLAVLVIATVLVLAFLVYLLLQS